MNLLELSQIIFYFTVSFAVIFAGALAAIIFFEVIVILRSLKNFLQNANNQSMKLYGKIDNFVERISQLPFISTFFKKKSRTKK